MIIYLLPFAMLVICLLLRLGIKLRLTLPIIYIISMLTVFRSFYRAHTGLADAIFFLLIALVVISWLISLFRWLFSQLAEQSKALALIRQAKESGKYRVRL